MSCGSRRSVSFKILIYVLALSVSFLSIPVQSVHAKEYELVVPVKVGLGIVFSVEVSGAPENAKYEWEADGTFIGLEEAKGSKASFSSAKITGVGWVSVAVITGAGVWEKKATIQLEQGIKVIKKPKWMESSKSQKIEALLSKAGDVAAKKGNMAEVFKHMGKDNISFHDLINYKADYEKAFGKDSWNKKYQHTERSMVNERLKGVQAVWAETVKDYLKQYPDDTIMKGDIGGWAHEKFANMTFASDIDFTAFHVYTTNSTMMRNIFESKLKSKLGMTMAQFDAFCTAQRRATHHVYIGEYGAEWGELDMVKRGRAQMYHMDKNGHVVAVDVPGEVMLRKYYQQRKKLKMTDMDIPKPHHKMEPGVSLEMLRHLNAEIFRGNYSTIEAIVKRCKYINRSTDDHIKYLGDAATTRDKKLKKFVSDVIAAKGNITDSDAFAKKVIELTGKMVNDPKWMENPKKAIETLSRKGEAEILHNVRESIDYHKKRIRKIDNEDTRKYEEEQMKKVLKDEAWAYKDDGVKFPDSATKALGLYAKKDELIKLFGEKTPDYVKTMAGKKGGAQIALSYLLKKANNNMDRVNDYIDVFDNYTIQKLRQSNVGLVYTDRWHFQHKISIGSINQSLNKSILGKVGNNVGFKGFNLANEAYAYYNAYASAGTNEEALNNVAMAIIRYRIPGSSIVEAVAMENYTRACIECVYLIFPPFAIPEALYNIASTIGGMGYGYGKGEYWQGSIDELSDAMYEESIFKPVKGSKGAKWKMVTLGYHGKKYPRSDLKKFMLTKKHDGWWFDHWVGEVLTRAVENDPVLLSYEEIMSQPLIGDKWRAKVQVDWNMRCNKVRLEFLEKLIEGVEERWAAFMLGQGIGGIKIEEVRKGLNCGDKPLVSATGKTEVDGEMYRQAMLNYQAYTEAIKKIDELSKKAGTKFGYLEAECSLDSLKMAAEWNTSLISRYESMIEELKFVLEDIKGSFSWDDKKDKKDMKGLMEYRKLAEPDLSKKWDLWKVRYEEELKKIKNRYTATVEDIVILPEDDIYEEEEVSFEAKLDLKEKGGVTYEWTIGGVKCKTPTYDGNFKGKVVPTSDGTLSITFEAKRDDEVIGVRKETVEIYPVELEGITVELVSGKKYLDEDNKTAQLKAISDYSDGSYDDVTKEAKWEVISDENIKVDQSGKVTLTETESYTLTGEEKAVVEAVYEDQKAEFEFEIKLALKDLGAYWEIDPKEPEIALGSEPHGVEVTFRAITDDPENNDKRKFEWTFQKEDASYDEGVTGPEVKRFYSELGQYSVLLKVTDEWGNVDEEHETITVEEEYLDEMPEELEEDVEDEDEEEKPFETPSGQANVYKGKLSGSKLTVERYDWKTPIGKDAGFVRARFWNYLNVGYFEEGACLKTGKIEKGTAFNPGYLIYYNSIDKSIHYAVLGASPEIIYAGSVGKEKGDYSHAGVISESNKAIKETIKITSAKSRSFKVSWEDAEGGQWSVIVNKYGGYKDVKHVEPGAVESAGGRNKYVGKMLTGKKLNVRRYDWETPLNKKAGFGTTAEKAWNYVSVGYWKGETCLKAGPPESGAIFNPGYVIYYSDSQKGIRYAVLGEGEKFVQVGGAYSKPKPNYSHHGLIGESVKKTKKDTIRITEVYSRSFRLTWETLDGKQNTAIVWKYPDNGGYTFEGEDVSKSVNDLSNEVTKDLKDMFDDEELEGISDEELLMIVDEEIEKMLKEEEGLKKEDIDLDKLKKVVKKKIEKKKEEKKLKRGGPRIIRVDGGGTALRYSTEGFKSLEYSYAYEYKATVPMSFTEFSREVKPLFDVERDNVRCEHVFSDGRTMTFDEFIAILSSPDKVDKWTLRPLHGKATTYSSNTGVFAETANYVNGFAQGPFRSSAGNEPGGWRTGNYVDGMKQGPTKTYEPDGQLSVTGNYLDGKWHGTQVHYDDGKPSWAFYYKNGKCLGEKDLGD
ncbi:MAG: hypothetical protein HQ594_06505 [Candidatus Omnitrophica bacterium]|nr:hypothetical protein [Candidatus Omnitrophota bacterium]